MEPEKGCFLERISQLETDRNTPEYINLNDLPETGIVLGRGKDTHVKLVSAWQQNGVSRKHAIIIHQKHIFKYGLIDNTSTNGVFVNGVKIPPEDVYNLKEGDVICFAGHSVAGSKLGQDITATMEFVYKLCRKGGSSQRTETQLQTVGASSGVNEAKADEPFSTEYLVELIKTQRASLVELNAAREADAQKFEQSKAELATVQANTESACEKVRELSKENEQMKRKMKSLKGVESRLRLQVENHPKIVTGMKREMKELQQELANTKELVATTEVKSKTMSEEHDKLKAEVEAANAQAAKLRKDFATLQSKYESSRSAASKAHKDLDVQTKALAAEKEKRRGADKMIRKLRDDLNKRDRRPSGGKTVGISRKALTATSENMGRVFDKCTQRIQQALDAQAKKLAIFETRVKLLNAIEIKKAADEKDRIVLKPKENL